MNVFQQDQNQKDDAKISYIKFAIEIQDSGIGISEDNLKKLFVDFMKVEDHNKINLRGTGLGLSICKLIVEKMRGNIEVKSQENVGTTFTIFINSRVRLSKEPKNVRAVKK